MFSMMKNRVSVAIIVSAVGVTACTADVFTAAAGDGGGDAAGLDSQIDTDSSSGDSSAEAGDASSADVMSDGFDGGPSFKRVFLSSTRVTSNFGGLTQGDAICNAAAAAAGLGGSWAAWLSTSISSAASRLQHSTDPYMLVDGKTEVAKNWSNLVAGNLESLIDRNESGVLVSFVQSSLSGAMWTGTNSDGTAAGSDCQGWTVSEDCSVSTAHTGIIGRDDMSSGWTNWSVVACCTVQAMALYCFEQ